MPVVLALTVVSLFMPARNVTIEGIGRLSFETAVTLTVGQQEAYAAPDTEILRPNDYGDEQQISTQYPDSGPHYDKVDDTGTGDGDATYLWETDASYHRDLYNLPAPSGSGTINFIKISFRVCQEGGAYAKPSLKTNLTPVDGTEISPAGAWTTYSEQWNTNPVTEAAWTWDEIDALQIGISLKGASGCTQLYVEVDYTPPAPAWLNCWAKRVKITIDHNDFAEDVTHFPVLIYLSSASGRDTPKDDVTFVFDEVAGNSKRIAVTKDDGTTQLYVEIEKWDATGEEAWLWVSKSDWTISSTTDTDIYLYYDDTQPDNDTWVGDSGSRTEVWNSNYQAVWHLSETTGGTDAFKDSTSNANHGTDSGSPGLGVTGQIGNAVEFYRDDESIDCGTDDLGFTGNDEMTFEAWFVRHTAAGWHDIVWSKGMYYRPFSLRSDGDTAMIIRFNMTGGNNDYTVSGWDEHDTNWYHFAVRLTVGASGDDWHAYENGTKVGGGECDTGTFYLHATDNTNMIGARPASPPDQVWGGIIDEVRISDIDRGDAWSTASYETQRDDLLDFGTEETLTLDISNTPASHDFQTVSESLTYTTGLTKFAVTNNSGRAIDISIQGTDMTGGVTWTLSNSCTPGPDTYGLMAGLEGGDYTIVVRKNSPFNNLVENLADSATQNWGLELWTPTSFSDGVAKSGTVTLTAICT